MSFKNDFDRMKVSFVIMMISIFSLIAFIAYLFVGSVLEDIPTRFLSFLINITILFILIHSFKKYHISIRNLFGSLSISNVYWLKLITIQLLITIFGVFSITTIFMVVGLSNSEFLKSFLTELDLSSTENNFLYSILFYILSITLTPVMEELLFRGYLFNKWGANQGVVKAMIFSSLLFSLLHFNSGFITHFFNGIFYCLVYLKTKKLILPILLHAFNNFVAGAVIFLPADNTTYEVDKLLESIKEMQFVLNVGTVLFIILIPIVCYILYQYYKGATLITPYQKNKELTVDGPVNRPERTPLI
ncbi:hypothetical protein UACE39S_03226 [Ureibacillus acetophenoni]